MNSPAIITNVKVATGAKLHAYFVAGFGASGRRSALPRFRSSTDIFTRVLGSPDLAAANKSSVFIIDTLFVPIFADIFNFLLVGNA